MVEQEIREENQKKKTQILFYPLTRHDIEIMILNGM